MSETKSIAAAEDELRRNIHEWVLECMARIDPDNAVISGSQTDLRLELSLTMKDEDAFPEVADKIVKDFREVLGPGLSISISLRKS